MKYKITYDIPKDLLFVKTSGKMNAGDFIAMAESLLEHPKCLTNGCVVFDHRALSFEDVSVEVLQKIRAFHMSNEERIGNGKSAIVVKAGFYEKWHKLWSQGDKIKSGNGIF